jgi:glycosyltransferase involved in cell wall biosynthesis
MTYSVSSPEMTYSASLPDMTYSVVVPTRDRPASLERCLSAVGAAAPGAQLIVVDDGSSDGASVEATARHHGAEVVRLARSGAAAARNAGARRASSEIVLFTDDDCVPDPGWGDALAAAVTAAAPRTIVGGRTVPGDATALMAASQSVVASVERATRFCATSNVGCHRQTVVDIPFDEAFAEASGEDRDWCARVAEAGGAVVREPRAVVRHLPEPGARAFWHRHVRYGRGARRLRSHGTPGARVRLGLQVVADGFRAGFRIGVLVILAQVATVVGYATGGRAAGGR